MKLEKKLLLVEDDPAVRLALAEALRAENYEVVSAANLDEALLAYSQYSIDIVLLDLNLGEEDGWDVFHSLKQLDPALPVIVTSAHAERLADAGAHSASAILEKPFDLPDLLRLLEQAQRPRTSGAKLNTLISSAALLLLAVCLPFRAGAQYEPATLNNVNNSSSKTGPACLYAVSGSSWAPPTSGGSVNVSVTKTSGNKSCSWTVSNPGSSWLTVTPMSGSGNGTVSLTAASNGSGSTRSTTLTIGGQNYTVTQTSSGSTYYSISTSSSPSAGGSTSGGGSYASGSTVTVTASANGGYNFVSWTENGSVVSASASYSFTASANRNLVANFSQTTYAITTSSSPSAGGSTSGGGSYTSGSTVTVTATANGGYNFVSWTENGTVVSGSASYSFSASANRNLVANFSTLSTYTITTSCSPSAGGTTSGGGSYTGGSLVTVTASAGSGYSFVSWTENGNVVSASASYSFTASANRALMANFSNSTTLGSLTWLATAMSQNGSAIVTGTAADHAGNIIVVGYFNGTVNLGLGPISTAYQSITAAFVAKYSPQGTLLWQKPLGGLGSDAAKSVAIDSQNNIIVVGNFQLTVDFGGGPLTAVSSVEMFVAKYSPSGAWIWANGYPGLSSDVGNTVAVDGSDNVVVAADCGYGANFGGVPLSPVGGAADLDIAIGKLSGTTGATLWAASHGGVYWEAAKAVSVDRNGDVVVTGSVQGTSTDLGGGTLSASGSYNILLAKYSGANGSYRWGKLLGASGGNYGCGVATDPNTGNIVMTGLFNGTLNFGGGGINGGSIFVVGYDPNGTWLWNTVTGTSSDSGAAVRIDGNGNLVVAGRCSSGIYFPGMSLSLFGNGQVNFWVASFTLSGNSAPVYRWAKMTGQNVNGASNGNAVALDPSGQIVAGGAFMATEDFGGGPVTATSAGYSSGFVTKYGN